MKKLLVLAAAALLSAVPAAAQQSMDAPSETTPVTSAPAAQTVAPSLLVTQDEIRQRVAAAEAEREGAQIGSSNFWYMVAAIALGIIIASLLLN
ncbi:hypothetical protein [Longimicrobium sp.]|jgi:uncharacterized lipoprotein YajG|uniref:hypothetical protein n=1 Tax=Longimicrobium sp. TaxID=2029185 RepID=UPI002F91E4BB